MVVWYIYNALGSVLILLLSIAQLSDAIDRIPLSSTTPRSQRFKDVIAITERLDPVKDGFVAEILAQAAERQLADLSSRWSDDREPADIDLATLFEDDTALISFHKPLISEPVTLFEDSFCRVRGIQAPPAPDVRKQWFGPDARYFLKLLMKLTELRTEFAVVSVEEITEKGFVTQVFLTNWGRLDESWVQQNATWRIGWVCTLTISGHHDDPQSPTPIPEYRDTGWGTQFPKIAAIESIAYEEITMAAPIFTDCTESVLGSAFNDQLRLGTEYWSKRFDRVLGSDILGHTGLCIGDVNNDGLDDLYVAQSGGLPNMLLVQNADGTVTDRAKEAHVDFLDMTRGCLFVDLDNDGDQDLALSIRNATVIMENDGTGLFNEKPVLSARTGTPSEFYSIAAADYDQNGFLDLYSTRYVKASYGISLPIPYFDANNGPPNHLLANLGGWKFDDVTKHVGLDVDNRRFSLAASWEDFDDDGDQDLYVANDFGQSNLYVNHLNEPLNSFGGTDPSGVREGAGPSGENRSAPLPYGRGSDPSGVRFTDESAERGVMNRAAGMGVTWADYDRDGIMDLYVSNMYSPAGHRIMGRPEFRPDDPAELRQQFLGQVMGNALFRGLPGGKFENTSASLRPGVEGWSWGSLFVDINNDGLEDILVPNGNLSGTKPDIDSLFWRAVASESPTTLTADAEYDNGWSAMSLLMMRDHSWAGHQRHATYLNLGNGQFADISVISGFGYLDDGRALAVTDWDQDGDLDVWIKNRTGPMLRFLRNETTGTSTPLLTKEGSGEVGPGEAYGYNRASDPPFSPLSKGGSQSPLLDKEAERNQGGSVKGEVGPREASGYHRASDPPLSPLSKGGMYSSLGLLLEGATCNRDAIGARVTIESGGKRTIETVRAGEGYLAQSTKGLHFALGAAERIDSIAVRWPGGETEKFEGVEIGHRYRLKQGAGKALLIPRRANDLVIGPSNYSSPSARVTSKQPGTSDPANHLKSQISNSLTQVSEPDTPRSAESSPIMLMERLALPNIPLTTTNGKQISTEDKLGTPFVLIFWSPTSPSSRQAILNTLRALAALRSPLVEIIPVCVNGSVQPDAEPPVCDLDVAVSHAVADAGLLDLIDVIQQEVMGHPDDLMLPTALVVDRLNRVVSLIRGGCDARTLVSDATREDGALLPIPGRTLFPDRRNYGFVADELRKRGHAAWFDFYRQLQNRRTK